MSSISSGSSGCWPRVRAGPVPDPTAPRRQARFCQLGRLCAELRRTPHPVRASLDDADLECGALGPSAYPDFRLRSVGPVPAGFGAEGRAAHRLRVRALEPGSLKEVASRVEGERGCAGPAPRREHGARLVGHTIPCGSSRRGLGARSPNTQFKVFLTRVATMVPKGSAFEAGWKVAPRGPRRRPEQSSPIFVEMAIPGTQFTRRMAAGRVPAQRRHRPPDALERRHGQQEITGCGERVRPRTCSASRRSTRTALKLARVTESLAALETRTRGGRQPECACLVNLGWGGGLLSKSPVPDAADEDYRRIVRALPFYERAVRTGLPFPKTRKVVFLGGEPGTMPGWAKLEVA